VKSEVAYIDDNKLNLECIEAVLASEFNVSTFQKPALFLKKYSELTYAAIIIDIHMPTMDGFALYEKLIEHPHYNGCPILFISSDDSEATRIRSFELGAVDFIERQIRPEEMVARIKSKILFFLKQRSTMELGNLRVNLTIFRTKVKDVEIPLTFIELKILCLSLKNFPTPVTKEQIIEHVWKSEHVLDATIYTHISNLNSKLKNWDYDIQAKERGKGFQVMKKENL